MGLLKIATNSPRVESPKMELCKQTQIMKLNNDVLFRIMTFVEDVDIQNAKVKEMVNPKKACRIFHMHSTNKYLWKVIFRKRNKARTQHQLSLPQRSSKVALVQKGIMQGVEISSILRGEFVFFAPEHFHARQVLQRFFTAARVKNRLNKRPSITELTKKNVIPKGVFSRSPTPENVSPRITRMVVKLQKSFRSDDLSRKLSNRKSLSKLKELNIVETGMVATEDYKTGSSILSAQKKIQQHLHGVTISQNLKTRPSIEDLIEKGILEVDPRE